MYVTGHRLRRCELHVRPSYIVIGQVVHHKSSGWRLAKLLHFGSVVRHLTSVVALQRAIVLVIWSASGFTRLQLLIWRPNHFAWVLNDCSQIPFVCMLLQIIAIQENKIKMTGALCFPMASAAVSHSARLLPELRLRSQREHNYNCPISVRYMVRCLICGASDCMMT